MCTFCGEGWRFETTELATGRVKAVLHPISAEWEELLCQPSTASIQVATRDPALDDVWPNESGLFISRVNQDGTRDARWGGYIENMDGSGGGSTQVAAVSMDGFLNHRLLADDGGGLNLYEDNGFVDGGFGVWVTRPVDTNPLHDVEVGRVYTRTQAGVAKVFVDLAVSGAGHIPLTAEVVAPAVVPSDGTSHRWWQFKNIGAALRERIESANGLKYWLNHFYANGYWSSVINFSDAIGTARDYTLRSDYEGWQYGLTVDGKDKASRVYGIGSGEEDNTQFSVAYDAAERLPEFQSTQAWKDQTVPATIDALTAGWVSDHRDPATVPALTLVGLPTADDPGQGFPPPNLLVAGDTFNVDIGYGVITVRGITVKALGVSWKLDEGKPVQRVLGMLPIIRPADSIRTQTPARPPAGETPTDQSDPALGGGGSVTADPWPTPGKVSNVQSDGIDEISGMEVSWTNPGYLWVQEDEVQNQQVKLLRISDGTKHGSYGVRGMPGNGDPESLRYSRVSKKMVTADTGDNNLSRSNCALYVVDEPAGLGNHGPLNTTKYPVSFPGGAKNVECLLIHPTTDVVSLVTKEANKARVYSFGPLSAMSTGGNVGTLVQTLTDIEMVSDGTHTLFGQWVMFRAAGVRPTVVYDVTGPTWVKVKELPTPPMVKSESIAVESTCSFLTSTETKPQTGAPIYRVLIPNDLGALCGTPAGPSGTGGSGTPSGPVVPAQVLNLTNFKLQLPIN